MGFTAEPLREAPVRRGHKARCLSSIRVRGSFKNQLKTSVRPRRDRSLPLESEPSGILSVTEMDCLFPYVDLLSPFLWSSSWECWEVTDINRLLKHWYDGRMRRLAVYQELENFSLQSARKSPNKTEEIHRRTSPHSPANMKYTSNRYKALPVSRNELVERRSKSEMEGTNSQMKLGGVPLGST